MFGVLKPFAFFLGGSASVLVLATVIGTAHPTFVALLCLVILLAGLPHGAFDYHIMSARYEGSALAFALVVYVGLAGITLGGDGYMRWLGHIPNRDRFIEPRSI